MVDRTEPAIVTRGAGSGTTLIAWVAFIVALLALVLAWMAYNRTGEDLENRIQDGVQEALTGVERGTNDAVDSIDEGPDGVDEDDTDVQPNCNGGSTMNDAGDGTTTPTTP